MRVRVRWAPAVWGRLRTALGIRMRRARAIVRAILAVLQASDLQASAVEPLPAARRPRRSRSFGSCCAKGNRLSISDTREATACRNARILRCAQDDKLR